MLLCSELLRKRPKFAQRQHSKVIDDCEHQIERQVFFSLFYIAKEILLTPNFGGDSGLRLVATGAQLCYREPEYLSRRPKPP